MTRALAVLAGLVAALGSFPAAADSVEDAFPLAIPPAFRESAQGVVERAFDNFYGCDLKQRIDFTIRSGEQEIFHYYTQMARKIVDGTAYQLIEFVGNDDFRKTRVLRIQQKDRSDDLFAYLPRLVRVRRLTTAQRADKVLGLNITLEDIETQWIEKFEIVGRSFGSIQGEPVHVVTLQSLWPSGYDRADFFIAQQDYAFLEIRFYRKGALAPFKVMRARRGDMQRQDGHVLPWRMFFHNRQDGTETEVQIHDRVVNPELPDSLFLKSSLEGKTRRLHFDY